MAPPKIPLEIRLSRWTNRDTDTGCWIWTGKLDHSGYAHIKWRGKDQKAATVVYEFYKGSIPQGLEVSHICPGGGNAGCVNPDHLIAETHAENLARREWQPKGQRYVLNCKICGKPKVYMSTWSKPGWYCEDGNRKAHRQLRY